MVKNNLKALFSCFISRFLWLSLFIKRLHLIIHTHTHTHTRTRTRTRARARARTHARTHVHTCTHMYTHVHTCTHMYTHVHTCTHIMYTHVHTCTHMYTHVHTRTLFNFESPCCWVTDLQSVLIFMSFYLHEMQHNHDVYLITSTVQSSDVLTLIYQSFLFKCF